LHFFFKGNCLDSLDHVHQVFPIVVVTYCSALRVAAKAASYSRSRENSASISVC
jgi:hypothetical protein